MSAPGLTHVEIGTSDLASAMDFYQGLLGFRPVAAPVADRPGVQWLSAGGTMLALVQAAPGASLGGWIGDDLQRGFRHVGFKVGDVPLYAERLRDAGVRFTVEPLTAVGDVRLAFFTDPDGTLLEIIDGHLQYHETWTPAHAERERAAAQMRPRAAGPAFDHVAVTVSDIDATLAFYGKEFGYEVIGTLDHDDSRGFQIHYLQAGPGILEVFSFTKAATIKNPASDNLRTDHGPADPGRLGIREIGICVSPRQEPADLQRVIDPDGIPIQLWTPEAFSV